MGPYYHSIKVGSIEIPGNIFLAPLAGFTDQAFREICLEWGADFAFTEMISCEGIIRKNRKTLDLLPPAAGEYRYGIQLFTAKPESAVEAVNIAASYKPALIDLNCGCPVPKVVKAGAGSALMRKPDTIKKIVSTMVEALNKAGSNIPVSVKLRSGWSSDDLTFKEAACAAVEGGAKLISLHPRTKTQGYSGKAEWQHILDLKSAFPSVPIIGSGDLFSPKDIQEMIESTGCDGVMIARGAIGNPFIFLETKALLSGSFEPPFITRNTRLQTALKHLSRAERYKGHSRAVKDMKKHLCSYTKGMPGGAELRNRIVQEETADGLQKILTEQMLLTRTP